MLQELEGLVRRNVDNFLDRSDKNDLQKASRDGFQAAQASLTTVIHKRLSPDARAVFSRDDIKNEIVLYVASSKRSQGEVVKSLACVILWYMTSGRDTLQTEPEEPNRNRNPKIPEGIFQVKVYFSNIT